MGLWYMNDAREFYLGFRKMLIGVYCVCLLQCNLRHVWLTIYMVFTDVQRDAQFL